MSQNQIELTLKAWGLRAQGDSNTFESELLWKREAETEDGEPYEDESYQEENMVQGISTSTADKRKLTRTHDSRCNKITCSPKKIHEIGGLLNFKRSPWKHVEWDFRASTIVLVIRQISIYFLGFLHISGFCRKSHLMPRTWRMFFDWAYRKLDLKDLSHVVTRRLISNGNGTLCFQTFEVFVSFNFGLEKKKNRGNWNVKLPKWTSSKPDKELKASP